MDFDNLHQVLRNLYQEMMPLCGDMIGVATVSYTHLRADRNIVPCFDSFYEYLRDDYRRALEEREIRVSREDFNIDNMLILSLIHISSSSACAATGAG